MISPELQTALQRAADLAGERGDGLVTSEHLLHALLADAEVAAALRHLGADPGALRAELEEHLESVADAGSAPPAFTPQVQELVGRAAWQLQASGHAGEDVPPIRVLPELLEAEDSFARYFLERQGVTRLAVLEYIAQGGAPGTTGTDTTEAAGSTNPLDAFTVNLSEAARRGELGPVIGRDAELTRVLHVLSRRTKNNPLLVGEAGVGKTALAEALALRLLEGAPPTLHGAELYALNLGALLAGSRYRGDFEARLQALLGALSDRQAVLFVDEVHTVMGAGRTEGSPDMGSLLKPALARGGLRLLGATTPDELRTLQKDRAMWRRLQPVEVPEPSPEETLEILRGLQGGLEAHHRVAYAPEALDAAVSLSVRLLRDRFLPDKAIDLLDEAGAAYSSAGRAGTVGRGDIEQTAARMARVPPETVQAEELGNLRDLGERLRARVLGQDAAVGAVVRAVKLARAGLRDPVRPQAAFLFAGPTGVGKTELSRALADALGVQLLRFDMSEYQEAHTVARLIGAPPGYVGFDQGGLMTDAIARHPHAVLLLDEIEKAHPDVYNLFLQLMDFGTLTDHNGRRVDGRHLIVVFTTNAGAEAAARGGLGFGAGAAAGTAAVDAALKRTFSPEFRNRLDAVLHFAPLGAEVMRGVVDKLLAELARRLEGRGVGLQVTDAARAWLATNGHDPALGARPLARLIERELAAPLSELLLFGELAEGGRAVADTAGEGLTVRVG